MLKHLGSRRGPPLGAETDKQVLNKFHTVSIIQILRSGFGNLLDYYLIHLQGYFM